MSTHGKMPVLVVVGAHPDDIACVGGTAALYAASGHNVVSLSVTLGETVRPPGPEQEHIKSLRRKEGEDIAGIIGAEFAHLDVPCNKIIPTMEMKMKLVNALRRLGANILLFPTPWDVHADHRNLSWTMRDVVYYVGHRGIAADYPPPELLGAYMYDIERRHNEMHDPDVVIDVTSTAELKFKAILCPARAAVFGEASGRAFMEDEETAAKFWGMRHGTKYAEPLFGAFGSMDTTLPVRKLKLLNRLPLV
ncbi:MAG TPA: hypothetical protein ENN09_04935 [Planctomycetes bacterium]|nr:hypothetical protein [Planctomycetota bacterium]